VLRAAASEVEQYERIELTSVPSAEVTGRIVNDLVHLLAELLENATSFSSPQTKVRVTGHSLPDGRVLIEIHDTGIGLSPEDLADINERLANPPTVDVSVSRRMGLFVVGRLSLRHGIRIQLRPSDSGGTTALVMLPVDVTQGGAGQKAAGPAGARPQTDRAAQGSGTSGIAGAFGNAPRVNASQQRGQVGGGAARPALGAGAGRPGQGSPGGPGGPQQGGGPRWAAQDSRQGGFPDERADTPRGHEDVEQTGDAFAPFDPSQGRQGGRPGGPQGPGVQQQPQQPMQQGPGQPGHPGGQGFPPPQPQNTGPGGFRSDVFGGRPGPAQRQGGDTGQFPVQGGPGDTAQFPPVRDDFAPTAQGGTGQFPAPGVPGGNRPGPQGPQGGNNQGGGNPGWAPNGQDPSQGRRPVQDPYGTGQFPVQGGPGGTGQYPVQGGPGGTAQFPQVRAEDLSPQDTGEFQAPPMSGPGRGAGLPQRGQRGPQGTPGWAPGAGDPYDTGTQQMPAVNGTGQYPVQQPPQQPQHTGQFPVQQPQQPAQGRPEPQLPPVAEPMALPPAPTRGDEPTPIFSAIESDWFRTGQAERMQQIHVEQSARGQQAPPSRPVGRTAPPQRPAGRPTAGRPVNVGQQPAPTAAAAPAAPAAQPLPRETPNWRSSPNDALRQRAEQVREPSAGGVTPSGLPRRVPRANLVAGGATQQQTPVGGPQVSRSPDDVRGRLTNLRRGIQQGRQAGGGTDGRGFGTNHQER
jgi:hypothetical protein